MTDWVVGALIGLGSEPQQAADVAQVFRSIRTMPDPDALQVFMGVVSEMGSQAEAHDAASIWKARAAEAGLRAEGLAGLLERVLDYRIGHDWTCATTHDGLRDCDCGLSPVRDEIDAALDQPAGTPDIVTNVRPGKDAR